jgi:hypothetical protein
MNSTPHNSFPSQSGEETLRLIASLPAPEGLEERLHSALRAAPRGARVLAWRGRSGLAARRENGWMRTAAAAAIVFVVVGGGWGVYTRVQQGQPAKVIVMPAHAGFSGAGAKRTPPTLPGPAVSRPAAKPHAQAVDAKKPEAPATKHAGQIVPSASPSTSQPSSPSVTPSK